MEAHDVEHEDDMEIEQLTGSLEAMEHTKSEEYIELLKKTIDEVTENLSKRDEELRDVEYHNKFHALNEWTNRNELNEATRELIKELRKMKGSESIIGVKQVGQIDPEVFVNAFRLKGMEDVLEGQGELVCSEWQKEISRPHSEWHPFKLTIVNGEKEEVLMEDDEKLVALKEEWGIEAHNAVVQALLELNEYNPFGRYPVHVLWKVSEDRKASIPRAVYYLVKLWKADMGKFMAQGNRQARTRTAICDKAPSPITTNCNMTEMQEARSLTHTVGGGNSAPLMTMKENEMENEATRSELCSELKRKIDELTEKLKERDYELQYATSLALRLAEKDMEMSNNLHRAKRCLIKGLKEIAGSLSVVGIKQMGQLDREVFLNACKLKGAKDHLEATNACLQWQYEISRTEWYPFKITYTDGDEEAEEVLVVVEDDEKLVALKEEWGVEVHDAVVQALVELEEYDPSRRHPAPELWNFKENRVATVAEGVVQLAKLWRANKGKYICT